MARPTLARHPKFYWLVRFLTPYATTVSAEVLGQGILEALWQVAYENGDAVLGPASHVEAIVGWAGPLGELAATLVAAGGQGHAGFLERVDDNGTLQVHDLEDHAPGYVQDRWRREVARREKGTTIRELRAAAGRAGGFAKAHKTAAVAAGGPRSPKPKASRRCPADFELTAELRTFAADLGLTPDGIANQLAKFKDQEFAKGHSDWPAMWRNWCRNHIEWNRGGGKRPAFDQAKYEAELKGFEKWGK